MDANEAKEQAHKKQTQKIANRYHIVQTCFFILVLVILAISYTTASRNDSRTQAQIKQTLEAQQRTLDALTKLSLEQKDATNDVKLTVKRLGDANLCVLLTVAQKLGQGIRLDSINTDDIKKSCQTQAVSINPTGTVLEQPKTQNSSPSTSNSPNPQPSPASPSPPKDEGLIPDRIPILGRL